MTRTVVGVDAPVLRAGLERVLAASEVEVLAWAAAPLELVEQVAPTAPDVVLCWFDSLRPSLEVAHAVAPVPVLAVSQVRRDEDLLDALTGGIRGLLERTCSPDQLVRAVHEVAGGTLSFPSGWERTLIHRLDRVQSVTPRSGQDALALTPRETDVLELLLEGYSVKQVANRLDIALQTTKNHIHHVMVKTGSTSRVELVKWAMRHGFRPSLPEDDSGPGAAVPAADEDAERRL